VIPSVSEQKKEHSSPAIWKYLWVFHLSRYYSCDRNQTKRLAFERIFYFKNGLVDNNKMYRSCMNRQFAWDWDPRTTADWTYLTNEQHANKTLACPRKYMWKTLIIEWYGEYRCNDVGWAIKGARLDVYAGIGDYAVDNWNSVPTGKKKIWIK
jgi:3D (Asp-Asp-Asp) domain-containing protein